MLEISYPGKQLSHSPFGRLDEGKKLVLTGFITLANELQKMLRLNYKVFSTVANLTSDYYNLKHIEIINEYIHSYTNKNK